ncbi:MAG: VWA domain-containing protein [Acidobacteria bacterium]|nr:VWA domain-containing protein [Acidobacteriota bacterium]
MTRLPIVLIVLTLAIDVLAQPTFRAGTEAVRLSVSPVRGGRPLGDLGLEHFEVFDNGQRQVIDSVTREQAPLRLTLVLDTSHSLRGAGIRALITAAQGLVHTLRPADEVSLITFAYGVQLIVPPTTDRAPLQRAIDGLTPAGPTPLRDALFAGLTLSASDPDHLPVVLLFTDGRDTASWAEASQLSGFVRRSKAIVHVVRLQGARDFVVPGSWRVSPTDGSLALENAVAESGGHVWSAARPESLEARFAEVLEELRSRYVLTFTPSLPSAPGWHQLDVRLKGVRGTVSHRKGYDVK